MAFDLMVIRKPNFGLGSVIGIFWEFWELRSKRKGIILTQSRTGVGEHSFNMIACSQILPKTPTFKGLFRITIQIPHQ
jgi:hypothetical protein